jgi:hypothetical protein
MNRLHSQENNWLRIRSNAEWKDVDDIIRGGHDGVIKDLHWTSCDYVDENLNMIFGARPKIWLLLQLQNKPVSSIEFLLTGVEEIYLNPQNELFISEEINEDTAVISLSHFADSRIKASCILYRIPDRPMLGNDNFNYF